MGCKQSAVRQHTMLSDLTDKAALQEYGEDEKMQTKTMHTVARHEGLSKSKPTSSSAAAAASHDVVCVESPLRLAATLPRLANDTDLTVSCTSEGSPFVDLSHNHHNIDGSNAALQFAQVLTESNTFHSHTYHYHTSDSECISVSSMTSPGRSTDTVEVVLQRSLNLAQLKKAGCVTVPSSAPQTRPGHGSPPAHNAHGTVCCTASHAGQVRSSSNNSNSEGSRAAEAAAHSHPSFVAAVTVVPGTEQAHKTHHHCHHRRRHRCDSPGVNGLSNAEIVSTIRNTSPVQLKSCLRT